MPDGDSGVGKEIQYKYKIGGMEQEAESSPEESFTAGQEYFEKYLKPVLPGLNTEISKIQTEMGLDTSKVGLVFLDRDGRPAMHAWNVLYPQYSGLPFPITSTQFPQLAEAYTDFADVSRNEPSLNGIDPDEWSRLFEERMDRNQEYLGYLVGPWVETIHDTLEKRLEDKDLVMVVDIGYRGSAAESGRFLVHKAFSEKTVKPILLYKYSDKIHTRGIRSDVTTWYMEQSIPHTTTGYTVNEETHKMRHLKEGSGIDSEIEKAFYRGVIAAAKKITP